MWKRVCDTAALGDRDLKQFEVGGVQILLVRSGEDFFAFPPFCPHQEEELEISGICDGEVLTCSKHLWQWDIRTGEQLGEAERPLLTYNTKVEDDEVHVFIERELRYSHDE
jgi:toluene monooxygenase system ferredoxin subunit